MKKRRTEEEWAQGTASTFTENDIISVEFEEKPPKLHYFQLFRYAKKWELACVIFGLLASAANGLLMPLSMTYFADIVNDIILPKPNILKSILPQVKIYSIIGGASLILGFLQAYLLLMVAERQSKRLRLLYFKSVLRQDVEWHEKNSVGIVITRISDSIDQIEEGIGANLTNFLRDISQFLAGLIIAFTHGWKLTLVAVALMPVISLVFTALALSIQIFVGIEQKAYSQASSVATEVLSAVRTVFAFGGETEATKRYERELSTAQRAGVKKSMAIGASVGMISFSIFSVVAILYYYGLVLITKEEYTPGKVVLVIMNIVYGSIAIGRSLPLMEFFLRAATVAQPVFATIERVPVINSEGGGRQLDNFRGQIEFRDVSFSYPQRPNIPILKHFNLKITPGETVAVVGPSGSGKSTIVQLIQRHYDVNQGQVLIDNVDIRDLDVKWLREQMGVVSQEPVLFAGSVRTNIGMMESEASQDDIEQAAKVANAHDFISGLPEGYETWIGEGGTGISGGQKQRVAIARALLRNPTVLLLDEATSALDTRSEQAVQAALDKAGRGRTVVMVAHRLTTVRNAGRIIVLDHGVIKETGTHEDLLVLGGIYAGMVASMNEETPEVKNTGKKKVEYDSASLNRRLSIQRSTRSDNGRQKKVKELLQEPTEPADNDSLDESRNKGPSVTWRTLKLSKPYAGLLAIGYLMAVGSGILEPCFALVYAETFDLYIEPVLFKRIPTRARLLAGMMSLVGFLRFLTVFCQHTVLGISGERLTKRMRKELFGAMLKQEAGWFDRPENQSGHLANRLATEVPCLRKVSGERGGVIVEGLVLVIVSLILAFYFSWQLALVNLAFIPPLALAGALQVDDAYAIL
uniref:Multidrug resistance protein 1 n=1 Tax=Schistocephalus solidus TaxID=70667 RepID=A0A0V0J9P1_SCHSO